MPNLTRSKARTSPPPSRVLLVRQPARSVRASDHPNRLPMRLALGVIITLGTLLLVWLIGHLGHRLGFAELMRVPGLTGEASSGLSIGTMVVISMPRMILQAGLSYPGWLMLAFILIAIPAGGLGAARPLTPGGPRLDRRGSIIAITGAVTAMASGGALIWWTGSFARSGMLRSLPRYPAEVLGWHHGLQAVAGFDVLATVCAALWVVLVLRLPIALWLRALAASAAFFTLVVVVVAMSISNTVAMQVGAARAVAVLQTDPTDARLLIGSTSHQIATLHVHDGLVLVDLRRQPETMEVTERSSIVRYLSERAPR